MKNFSNNPSNWGFYIKLGELKDELDSILLSPTTNGKLSNSLTADNLPKDIKHILEVNFVNVEGELQESVFEFVKKIDREEIVSALVAEGFVYDERLGNNQKDYSYLLTTKTVDSELVRYLQMYITDDYFSIYFQFDPSIDIVRVYESKIDHWKKDVANVQDMLQQIYWFTYNKVNLLKNLGWTVLELKTNPKNISIEVDDVRGVLFETETPKTIYIMGGDIDCTRENPEIMLDDDFVTLHFSLGGSTFKNITDRKDFFNDRLFQTFQTDGYLNVLTDETISPKLKEFLHGDRVTDDDSGHQVLILKDFVGKLYTSAFAEKMNGGKFLKSKKLKKIFKEDGYTGNNYPDIILSTDAYLSGEIIDLPYTE